MLLNTPNKAGVEFGFVNFGRTIKNLKFIFSETFFHLTVESFIIHSWDYLDILLTMYTVPHQSYEWNMRKFIRFQIGCYVKWIDIKIYITALPHIFSESNKSSEKIYFLLPNIITVIQWKSDYFRIIGFFEQYII